MTAEDELRRLVDPDALYSFAAPPAWAPLLGLEDPELVQAHRTLAPWDGDVRAALKATHPDTPGGDHELFLEVMAARDLLRQRSAV